MPVAPHLSMDRGIVLPEGSTAIITVQTDHEALLSCDGQASERMANEDRLLVSAGRHEAMFLRVQGRGYFFRNTMSRMKRNS